MSPETFVAAGSSAVRIRVFLLVFAPLVAIYAATATWGLPNHTDAMTNAVTAWYLGNEGTPILSQHGHLTDPRYVGSLGWYAESPRGAVAQYPPGSALLAAPLYRAFSEPLTPQVLVGSNAPDDPVDFPLPPLWPATLTGVWTTALAMAFLALAFLEIGSAKQAVIGAYVYGLGTTAWSVASDQLWQHGPAMMWLAMGLYFAARRHHGRSGLAFGAAVITRPVSAVVAAGTGIGAGFDSRSPSSTLKVGLGSAFGLALLVSFNWWLFGEPSISGGYGDVFAERFASSDLGWYLANVARGFVDPERGFLIWSPFLLILLPGVASAWASSPGWARGSALGGLAYLLIQLRAETFTGGSGFFAYRYTLETVLASAPLFFHSWVSVVRSPGHRLILAGAVVVAVVAQAYGAVA